MKRILSAIVTTDPKNQDLTIAPVQARSPFYRSPAIHSLAVTGSLVSALLLSSQVSVSAATFLTFTGGPVKNSTSGSILKAEVTFSLEPIEQNGEDEQKLIITLTNTNTDNAKVPSDLLTAVFFNGFTKDQVSFPTLTAVVKTPSAAFPGGTTVPFNPGDIGTSKPNGWKVPNNFDNPPLNTLPGLSDFTYGLGTAGFEIFQGGGGQQLNYGIATWPCADPSCYNNVPGNDNGNGTPPLKDSGNTFIRNSIRFELTAIDFGFSLDKITKVRFQYGTDLKDPSFHEMTEVPEPSLLLGLGAVVGGGVLLRRRKSL